MRTADPTLRIPVLTSLRFFAAIAIVALHLGGHFGIPKDITFGGRVPLHHAVGFFFVLSGFVLTMVYPRLEEWTARRRFLVARFARLWPGHLLGFLFWLVVAIGIYRVPLSDLAAPLPWLANILMVHSWVPLKQFYASANIPSWSIATEFAFYLAFPLLIVNLSSTWALKLLVGFVLALIMVLITMGLNLPYEGDTLTSNGMLYMNPLARVFEFSLGAATCCLWRQHTRFPGVVGATCLEVGAVLLVGLIAFLSVPIISMLPMQAALWLHAGPFSAPGFAVLLFVMAVQRGLLSKMLSVRLFVFLGEISYSVYLMHLTLLGIFYHEAHRFASWPHWLTLLTFLATLLAIASASYYCFENPLRKAIVANSRASSPVTPVSRPDLMRV